MNINVLLVEDHKILREGLVALLNMTGDISVVAEASDGMESVELTKKYSPDVIVMDLSLPLMGGIEATRQIVANNPDSRVLIFSMFLDKKSLVESLEAGAKGYLVKECASEELVLAIRTVRAEKPYFCDGAMQIMINGFAPGSTSSPLTKREQEVLKLTSECYNTKEIAFELGVSIKMIEKHRKHVKEKLGVKNAAQLVTYAARIGLISMDGKSCN